ncbi:MAG TPA: ParB/RepB/Spo0J family partition protein [Pyrinomonadaceae bacterium]|nr:ParB/RepB/Spo0J family partition protein [Pyrinomonadaceae bacterium]HMP64906.1 ParB/RepB/Spo0J family partition protein [Pyrinomonadaceae bacterium]
MRHDEHYVETLAAPISTIGRTISIDLIEPNPEQPRSEFGDLSELTASIKEKGVLEPLLVKPNAATGKWMIIAGERRWRSAKLAGLTEVPCIEMDLDEHSVAEIALVENLQRKDLTVWEEADGLAALVDKFGYTQEQISQKISKSRTTVTELLTIAGLPDEIRQRCHQAKINAKSVLLEVARQFDDDAMHTFVDGIIGGNRPRSAEKGRKPKPTVASSASEVDKKPSEEGAAFQYRSEDLGFQLQITFDRSEKPSRALILKALKKVFQDVKDDRV